VLSKRLKDVPGGGVRLALLGAWHGRAVHGPRDGLSAHGFYFLAVWMSDDGRGRL
jgi:hypothetical protein